MADGSIHIDTHLDDSGLKSGIEKMKGTVSKGFGVLGSLAVKGLAAATAATATFVVAATKAGIDFESAFAGVKKTVDATDEELAQLRTGILDMSKEIPLAATEIAGIAEAAGQLGIKTENLLDFTEVMANLGVSTNMSADEAATALARLANITQMPQDQFDRLGSTVVALGNNFATTESEIVDMALRLAGTGSQVGLSEAQILSFSAALSSVGLEAELGGSAFSRVFKMMQLATETEGEALEAFAAVAGMSASEFKRAFEEDAASAMIAFVAGLGNAEQHGMTAIGVLENMSEVEGLNALSSVAVSDALLRAAGSSDVMAEALQVGSQAWEENTALTNEASQRYETLESKIQLLKNTATAFMITMSDSWRGTCAEFVSAGTQMIASLDAAFQSGGINGLVEALGPALEQAVTLILSYVPRFMEVAVQILSGLAQGILNNLPLLTQAAVQVITQLVTGFVNAFPQILSTGAQILSILVQGIIKAAPTIFDAAVDVIDDFPKGLASKLPDVMAKAGELIQRFAAKISEKLPVIIESGIQVINNFTRGLADNIVSYTSIIDGKTYTGANFTTEIINASGKVTAQITVRDSRGRTSRLDYEFEVVQYDPPAVTSLTAIRCDADGNEYYQGQYCKLTFSAEITSLNGKNSASYRVEYKKQDESAFNSMTASAYSGQTSISSGTVMFAAENGSSYNIYLYAVDDFGESSKYVFSPSVFRLIHFGADGQSIAFFKRCEGDVPGDFGQAIRFSGGYVPAPANSVTSMDDLLTPGCYVSNGYSIENAPFYGDYFVEVRRLDDDESKLMQKADQYDDNGLTTLARFMQIKNGVATWTAWKKLYAMAEHRHAAEDIVQNNDEAAALINAMKSVLIDTIYPVGSIYISVSSTSPATLFGGSWTQIKDRFLLAAGSSYFAGEEGGAASYALSVAHTHVSPIGYAGNLFGFISVNGTTSTGSGKLYRSITAANTGSSLGGNVNMGKTESATVSATIPTLPPYLGVYVWERTK